MNSASADRFLGEYHLKQVLSENAVSRTWLAEQVSVSRRVLVDELRPECLDQKEAFLADVRAKAAVDHPLIGSVYEAVNEADLCFFAHELLPGATLKDRLAAAEPLPPGRLAHLLRRIAEAQYHHEMAGQATLPPVLENIHVDDHGVIRIDNLAVAGVRPPDQSTRDIARFGEALRPLVADGRPGTTRMLTLLGWMRGEGLEQALGWPQVRDICGQIEQQLADPPPPASPTRRMGRARKNKLPASIIAIAAGLALLVVLALSLYLRPKNPPPRPRASLPDAILIPAGRHPTPDGTEEELRSFRISPHEITISQYAAFLETLETLSKDQRERTFDHESQPPEKTSHLPTDWATLIAAAKSNGTWNHRPVTLDTPVVGVDWWDASAYAEWKQARLPTQEEWFAALRKDVVVPAALLPEEWLPVTRETKDRTPNGVIGLAGSVCEWTRRPSANPANPLGERKWLIIGGSFLKPGSNALTREWTSDRSLRRSDLGFRVVFEAN